MSILARLFNEQMFNMLLDRFAYSPETKSVDILRRAHRYVTTHDRRQSQVEEMCEVVTRESCSTGGRTYPRKFILAIKGELLAAPKYWLDQIERAEEIELRIDSVGGDVMAAQSLLHALRGKKVSVTISYAASAAADIGCLVEARRRIRQGGHIVLHRAGIVLFGDYQGLREAANELEQLEMQSMTAYIDRTKQPEAVVAGWFMSGKDVVFTAKEALEAGLVDEILPEA